MLSLQYESTGYVQSPMDQVFAHIDDHTRLTSHMGEASWRTGGGRLETQIDQGRGQKVSSRIRLSGRVCGVDLSVEEIVVERDPPRRKVWETTGAPQRLVIGHYRMGFDLSAYESGSLLGVFIDYALPARAPARWLGRLFGPYYARWRTRQMVDDAVKHFRTRPATQLSN